MFVLWCLFYFLDQEPTKRAEKNRWTRLKSCELKVPLVRAFKCSLHEPSEVLHIGRRNNTK